MSDFLRACVTRYTELTSVSTFRHVATPFLDVADSGQPTVGKFIPEDYCSDPSNGSAEFLGAAASSAVFPGAAAGSAVPPVRPVPPQASLGPSLRVS